VVRGNLLAQEPGDGIHITTTRAAAEFLGIELSAEPGVGRELPPFAPDAEVAVDKEASLALGRWYALGAVVLAKLGRVLGPTDSMSEPQLWPEHFDLATVVVLKNQAKVNIGFSAGDRFSSQPYVYLGPQDLQGVSGEYWKRPSVPTSRTETANRPSISPGTGSAFYARQRRRECAEAGRVSFAAFAPLLRSPTPH
jgi:hypothetical protein